MTTKRYEITITETKLEEVIVPKQWARVTNDTDSPYDYTPETTTHDTVTRTIYTQNTDELDLKAVILAINGIKPEVVVTR